MVSEIQELLKTARATPVAVLAIQCQLSCKAQARNFKDFTAATASFASKLATGLAFTTPSQATSKISSTVYQYHVAKRNLS